MRAAWAMVRSSHPVHSVLWLVGVFVNAAVRRLRAEAEFMALLLRVVYVGAIAVLFLFVVMMLNLSTSLGERYTWNQRRRIGRTRRATLGGYGRVRGARGTDGVVGSGRGTGTRVSRGGAWAGERDGASNRTGFGRYRYQDGRAYVVLAGVVLLVARVGAVVLTLKVRMEVRAKRQQTYQQRSRDAEAALVRVSSPRGRKG